MLPSFLSSPCRRASALLYTSYPKYSKVEQKTGPKYAHLRHRQLIEVQGRDATSFIQGLVTNDVERLLQMKCMYAMMLNQHGRVMHDLMLYHIPQEGTDSMLVECDKESVEALMKTLKLYKLRKKLTMNVRENLAVVHAFQPNSIVNTPSSEKTISSHPDPRVPMLGARLIVDNTAVKEFDARENVEEYHRRRVCAGVPEGVRDLPLGDCLPLECNLDYMNGVSFHKGCYIGQELTARTKFTGVIRKRLLPITIVGDEPIDEGTTLYTAKGKKAGKFRSQLIGDSVGLAIVRLNYADETLSTKAGHQVKCSVPSWWPFADGSEFSDGVCGPNVEENNLPTN